MDHENTQSLTASALKVRYELSIIKDQDKILKEAARILEPLISLALGGRVDELPNDLPNRRFFTGMQEDCLPAWHLDKTGLLNAIGEFGVALREIKKQ